MLCKAAFLWYLRRRLQQEQPNCKSQVVTVTLHTLGSDNDAAHPAWAALTQNQTPALGSMTQSRTVAGPVGCPGEGTTCDSRKLAKAHLVMVTQ